MSQVTETTKCEPDDNYRTNYNININIIFPICHPRTIANRIREIVDRTNDKHNGPHTSPGVIDNIDQLICLGKLFAHTKYFPAKIWLYVYHCDLSLNAVFPAI